MEPSEEPRRVVTHLLAQTGGFTFEPAREVALKRVEGLQEVDRLPATR